MGQNPLSLPHTHLRSRIECRIVSQDADASHSLTGCRVAVFCLFFVDLAHGCQYSVPEWRKVGGDGPGSLRMFRGATKVTLDAKGRMAIPARYRERLLTVAGGHLVATVDRVYCLLIYPLPDWEEIERKLVRLPTLNEQVRRLQGLMLGHASELEMDGHGRVLLPRELRDFAGLERQAMLIGQGNKFELWSEERWIKRRTDWLADEGEQAGLPQELESLSL
jgi:MraZ protein